MSRYTTTALFGTLAAVWGGSFVAARAVLPFVPPITLAALRFYVAGVLMVGYASVTTDRPVPRTRTEWRVAVVGGLSFVAAHHAFLFAGQQYVTSAVAAVVVSLDPVLAAGFAHVLLPDDSLSVVGLSGVLLGLVGVVVIVDPSPAALGRSGTVGVLLVTVAAVAFALGAVATRRYRTDLPVQSMQAWMMVIGAPVLHVAAVLSPTERFGVAEWSPTAVVGFGYLSVVAAAGGYLIYFELLDRLGPVEINLVGYVAPVFAAVGGWLFLGESVSFRLVVGFIAILAGFLLVKRRAIRAESRRLFSS